MRTRTFPPKGSVYGDRWRKAHKARELAQAHQKKIEALVRLGDDVIDEKYVRRIARKGDNAKVHLFSRASRNVRSLCRRTETDLTISLGNISMADVVGSDGFGAFCKFCIGKVEL